MKNEPITGGWKKLKSDLAAMTFKEKLNHIWTYYKGALVILAIMLALSSIVVSSCRSRNTQTLLSGIGINVYLTDEGQSYVKDEYFERVKTEGLEQVIYTETTQDAFTNTSSMEESYMSLMSLIALGVSEELDYLLLDETALTNLLAHDIYMDLRDFFTEEELEEMADNVIWLVSGAEEEAELMPVAIKVEHIPFFAENAQNTDDTFFALVTNTPRKEACRDFWEYINAWTPAN